MLRWILSELWADRVRTSFVALGVLWGTLGLASLLAYGSEMTRAMTETTSHFGRDLLRVSGAATTRPFRGFPAGRTVRLEPGDELLVAGLPGVRGSVLEHSWWGQTFRVRDARHVGTLVGTQPGFAELRAKQSIHGGRFLSLRDVREGRSVCFLGSRAATGLFGAGAAIGEDVEILGQPFLVIGVSPPWVQISNYNGDDRDKVMIPDTTYRALTGGRNPSYLIVGLDTSDDGERVEASIYRALGARRGFDPLDTAALEVRDHVKTQRMITSIMDGIRSLTAVVGVLGFLVAALGVANVTWVRVEEKRREIGLAMALGARRVHVMAPPIAEACLVALGGGVLGLALAAGLFAAAAQIDMPTEARAYLGTPLVSLGLGAAIVILLTCAGAISGWVPARRAARVDPMVVLREE